MTTEEFLKKATNALAAQSIDTARLDSLILMEYVLDIDRAKLLANPDSLISSRDKNVLNRLIAKRESHMPIAYITHSSEFYGRSFYIDNHVLQPRPESETMIDLMKGLLKDTPENQPVLLADIGTGSGALGITAMLECPNVQSDLIDIDPSALGVAKKNVVIHTINSKLINADLLLDNTNPYDILLCNLPYIPDNFNINLAAGHEPRIAIFGGSDGLDIYRKLFEILTYRQHKPLYILTESLPSSHLSLSGIAKGCGYKLTDEQDFIQVFSTVSS